MGSGFAASRRPGMTAPVVPSLWIAGTSPPASAPGRIRRIFRTVPLSRPKLHALSAPVPRRIARPASGLRRRRPAGEIEEARPRMGRPLAVQSGKNPLVHGQRPKGIFSRFLLGQARQHFRLRDGDRRRDVPGGGGAARLAGRRSGAETLQGGRSARGAPQDPPRRARACGEILRIDPRFPGRRQGARLSRRSRHRARRDRKSTRLNSSHVEISYAVFCLKKKKKIYNDYYYEKKKKKEKTKL